MIAKEILKFLMIRGNAVVAFVAILFSLSLVVPCVYARAKSDVADGKEIQGHVDSLVINGNSIKARGWAGVVDPHRKLVSLAIWSADTLVYEGHFEPFERPDVAKEKGRDDWLMSGWRINAVLPDNLKVDSGVIKVVAGLDNGHVLQLVIAEPAKTPSLMSKILYEYHKHFFVWNIRIVFFSMLVLLCVVFFQADSLSEMLFVKTHCSLSPPKIFGFTLLLTFLVLLGLGATGSSIWIGLQHTQFVQSSVKTIFGKNQSIRGDEWVVSTPLAIAQFNHTPKFPILNTNYGIDGQNMLIAGNSPVAHITAIAKPVTWGFFLFDLKRALSWYWYFPVFSCLFALWGVMELLLPGQWRTNFLIALWFNVSPYVSAWSNSPTYAVFFPSLALIVAVHILRINGPFLLLGLGCLLGVILAGFVLLLYPPWQVSLSYVFLALAAGLFVRDKLYVKFNKVKLLSYVIAIIVAGVILSAWWIDAHVAIKAMSDTVYPGQRTTVTGGNLNFPHLLRGFTNIVTLCKTDLEYSNQSEVASFPYMLLPLLMLFALRLCQKKLGTIEIALALVISFMLFFMLVGVPKTVSQLSLWGYVASQRSDLALGLSYILLCGVLLSSTPQITTSKNGYIKILASAGALAWAAIVFLSLSRLHEKVFSSFGAGVLSGLFCVVVLIGFFLIMGKFREFIFLNLMLSIVTVWPFNPINIAPDDFTTVLPKNDNSHNAPPLDLHRRTLVLESRVATMYLLAGGQPVVNAAFYYPQKSLWERLDQDHVKANIHNRYHHLTFSGGYKESQSTYQINLIATDSVQVKVDLEQFDFRMTGAEIVVAPEVEAISLCKNSVLKHIKRERGWSWFQVVENGHVN